MKYLLIMILLVSGLAADVIQTDKGMHELNPMTRLQVLEVNLDFGMALYRQKMAKKNIRHQGYGERYNKRYNRHYRPYITIINKSEGALKPFRAHAGNWSNPTGQIIYANSKRMRKIYDRKQIEYFMSDRFKVASFIYRGTVVYVINNK